MNNLCPRILDELAHEIADPVTQIFTESMNSGIVAYDWKIVNRVYFFNKSDADNYRPIRLTSIYKRS